MSLICPCGLIGGLCVYTQFVCVRFMQVFFLIGVHIYMQVRIPSSPVRIAGDFLFCNVCANGSLRLCAFAAFASTFFFFARARLQVIIFVRVTASTLLFCMCTFLYVYLRVICFFCMCTCE